MPEPETPTQTPETTPAKEILSTLVSLTGTLKEVSTNLNGVMLELRKANQLDVEKMRFNRFMDVMRTEYEKLTKRMLKEALNVPAKGPRQSS